jgi:hypothetical protein
MGFHVQVMQGEGQITAIDQYVLRMSKCLQRKGIRCGGKLTMRFRAPKQFDTTSTDPASEVCTLFTLTRTK